MGKINVGRVIMGGLVCGLIFLGFDMLGTFTFMADDMKAFMDKNHVDEALMKTAPAMIQWVSIDLIIGIMTIWNYALARPRLGPGPKTAIVGGLVIWISINAVMFSLAFFGVFSMAMFYKTAAQWLVAMCVGAPAGAMVYKES